MATTGARGEPTKVYKDIVPDQNADDRFFVETIPKITPYTMTLNSGVEATYALFQAVKYVVQNRIAGDIVECGVWKGGSMMLVAYALRHFGDTSRELHLYDTFAGMTEPNEVDVDFDGRAMKPIWAQVTRGGFPMGFGGSVEEVKANLRRTGYPEQQTNFVVGDVTQTVPTQKPARIALLRLDTDWYQSTLCELQHLYERLAPHGVLMIDDYGWCRGARQATDEFFATLPFQPMMHRVDQSVRTIIKPA